MGYSSFALFVGALLDALIGSNLVVPGEPFLIAAGYQLQFGEWHGVIAVLSGAWLGDQSSYWIGRRYGSYVQRRLLRWQPRFNRPLARCRLLMRQSGSKVLLFARLLGPIAWIVPFVAGTQQINWQKFSFYDGIGVVLGVGQFVFWGFLLAYGIDNIPFFRQLKQWVNDYAGLLVIGVTLLIVCWGSWRYYRLVNRS